MTANNDLEFNGPFKDWYDVVRDFGADPTGVRDSTAAIQKAIDAICATGEGGITPDGFKVYDIYIPSGTYKITSTIYFPRPDQGPGTLGLGTNIWGADPDTTILKWAGPSGGTMLWQDGCHSATIGRLTFEGNNVAGTGLQMERNFNIGLNSSYCRLQDCNFNNFRQYGFANTDVLPGASTDSEYSIMRCNFYKCATAGFSVSAGEAYNYWLRDCYFERNGTGVKNGPSGDFHLYDCVFVASRKYDIDIVSSSGGGAFRTASIRRCYSQNSDRFARLDTVDMVLDSNTVINTVQPDSIQIASRKKLLFYNNSIKTRAGNSGPAIVEESNAYSSGPGTDQATFVAYNNRFTVDNPIQFYPDNLNTKEIGTVTNARITATQPELPTRPASVTRPIFYIENGGMAQDVVDAAAAWARSHPGSKPVVYLLNYDNRTFLTKPLVFPANVEMSLQGCGEKAMFRWDAASTYTGPYVIFRGPSKVTVMNIELGATAQEGGKHGPAAVIDNCDQVGARISGDNCSGVVNVLGLANTAVEFTDQLLQTYEQTDMPWTIAGPTGTTGNGYVLIEGAASSSDGTPEPFLRLQSGGVLYLRDLWYETNNTDQVWGELTGGGTRPGRLNIEASFIEQHSSADGPFMLLFKADQFDGTLAAYNSLIIGAVRFTNSLPTTSFFSLSGGLPLATADTSRGGPGDTPSQYYRFEGSPNSLLSLLQDWGNRIGAGEYGSYTPAKLASEMGLLTSIKPTKLFNPLPEGVTDIRFIRTIGDIVAMPGTYDPASGLPTLAPGSAATAPLAATAPTSTTSDADAAEPWRPLIHLTTAQRSLQRLTPDQIFALMGWGVDGFDSDGGFVNLTVAQYWACRVAGIGFGPSTAVVLRDQPAALAALDATTLAGLADYGVSRIRTYAREAVTTPLVLSIAQYKALGTVALAPGDTVVLADAGDRFAGLDFQGLAASGIDIVSTTDGTLRLDLAQFAQMGAAVAPEVALTIEGTPGDDLAVFPAGSGASRFDGEDSFAGGAGFDTLALAGDYSAGLAFGAGALSGVERIALLDGGNFHLIMDDGNVGQGGQAAAANLLIDAGGAAGSAVVTFDGSAESSGSFTLRGGHGAVDFTGGRGADRIDLQPGAADTLHYSAVSHSSSESGSEAIDTVSGFDFDQDRFDVTGTIASVATARGDLRPDSVETGLAAGVAAILLAFGAVLFTPSSEASTSMLVVDQNGIPGYQSGEDLVVRLVDATGTFGPGCFV